MKSAKKHRAVIVPITLRDVYADAGVYSAKLLISPTVATSLDGINVSMRDADGAPMEMTFKRWGTKLNIEFKIDQQTPDGVSVIDIELIERKRQMHERFCYWVIK